MERRIVSTMAPYERLVAWKECHALALFVYEATSGFPKHELYGLTSQARRAAFSAAANIVEGVARPGATEFRRFLDISLASLSELAYTMRFAKELHILDESSWARFDSHQNRARYLTWKLHQALSRIARPRR